MNANHCFIWPLMSTLSLLCACRSVQQIALTAEPVAIATLERTGCLGQCPTYQLTLFDNGRLWFRGIAHTTVTDTASLHLHGDRYARLRQQLDTLGSRPLDQEYLAPVSDAAISHLTYFAGSSRRKVSFSGEEPPILARVVAALEREVYDAGWIYSDRANESHHEIIVEIRPEIAIETIISRYHDHDLRLVKKVTPTRSLYLLALSNPDNSDILELLRSDDDVMQAQWNHRLKRREE